VWRRAANNSRRLCRDHSQNVYLLEQRNTAPPYSWHGSPGVNSCSLDWVERYSTQPNNSWPEDSGTGTQPPPWVSLQQCFWWGSSCLTQRDTQGAGSCSIYDAMGFSPLTTIIQDLGGGKGALFTYEICKNLTLSPGCIGAVPASCQANTSYFKFVLTVQLNSNNPPIINMTLSTSTASCAVNSQYYS